VEHQEKIWPTNSEVDGGGEGSLEYGCTAEALVRATQRMETRRSACDEGVSVGEPWGRLMVRLEDSGVPFSLKEQEELASGVRVWVLRGWTGMFAGLGSSVPSPARVLSEESLSSDGETPSKISLEPPNRRSDSPSYSITRDSFPAFRCVYQKY